MLLIVFVVDDDEDNDIVRVVLVDKKQANTNKLMIDHSALRDTSLQV